MSKFHLIFRRNSPILLSRKTYANWMDIQNEFEDYMASIEFDDLIEVIDYLKTEYKITNEKAEQEAHKLLSTGKESVQLDI